MMEDSFKKWRVNQSYFGFFLHFFLPIYEREVCRFGVAFCG
jgi:hypothetical protein